VSVRVRRPFRFVGGLHGRRSVTGDRPNELPVNAPTAAEVLLGGEDDLCMLIAGGWQQDRLQTPRSLPYLRWRYAADAGPLYHALIEREGGRAAALAIFRVRPRGSLRETTISELFVDEGRERLGGRLLRRVAASAPVDHLTCCLPAASPQARSARRSGFVPTGTGITVAVNQVGPSVAGTPLALGSFALSVGDLELF
jgi:hypothetical protein